MELINETDFPAIALPFTGPEGTPVLTVVVKGTFAMVPDEPATAADEQLPLCFGDEFNDPDKGGSVKFESDLAPYKPRADIVLVGMAHAPGGRPATTVDVSVRVGQTRKVVRVLGNRAWRWRGPFLAPKPGKPAPFTQVPLVYERAFGGIDKVAGGAFAENPLGRGFAAKRRRKALKAARLPNLEDPRRPVRGWKDRPRPACFGFWGKGWQPRLALLGTYDDTWRETRAPEPPEDFRFEFHNGAHPDLQVEGWLKGDEEVSLRNVSKSGHLRFKLPEFPPACRIERYTRFADGPPADFKGPAEEPAEAEDLTLRADTLCLLPEEERFTLVWRGICPVRDLSAVEIKSVRIT